MVTCEFHGEYADYLTDQVAIKLICRGGQNSLDWSEVLTVVNTIAICKNLERITPGEAENLTSIVFKLYPQFEEKIRTELTQQFG
jgi:hypothetical protein